jgi:hypothetical protein
VGGSVVVRHRNRRMGRAQRLAPLHCSVLQRYIYGEQTPEEETTCQEPRSCARARHAWVTATNDFTADDAVMGEHFTDAQLARMNHPLGIVECPRCEGTGLVSEGEYLDVMAASRAIVDQIIARLDAEQEEERS